MRRGGGAPTPLPAAGERERERERHGHNVQIISAEMRFRASRRPASIGRRGGDAFDCEIESSACRFHGGPHSNGTTAAAAAVDSVRCAKKKNGAAAALRAEARVDRGSGRASGMKLGHAKLAEKMATRIADL